MPSSSRFSAPCHRLARCLNGLAAALVITTASAAAEPEAPPTIGVASATRGAVAIFFENDLFVGLDRNYTNGVQIAYISPAFSHLASRLGPLGEIYRRIDDALPSLGSDRQVRAGFTLGQLMFTPRDISVVVPDPNDRPYAGWLYLGFSGLVFNPQISHRVEFQIGLVGPASLAEPAQKFIHSARDLDTPMGWDSQLRNEVAFLLSYEQQRRLYRWEGPANLGWEIFGQAGAVVGTVRTHASVGTQLRFGWHLPTDFGGSLIRPAGDTFVPSADDPDFSITAFVGGEMRAVARDLFLDGNTFSNSPSVPKEKVVRNFVMGVSFGLGDWKLTYSGAFRSREFQGQAVGHRFASMTLSKLY